MFVVVSLASNAFALSDAYKENIYQVGKLKPVDSVLKVKVGHKAPGFTLQAVGGKKVSLKDYAGKKMSCFPSSPPPGPRFAPISGRGIILCRTCLKKTTQYCWVFPWIISPRCIPGPNKWGISGSRFSPISGRMAPLLPAMAFYVPTAPRSGRLSSSIKRASSATSMFMTSTGVRRWKALSIRSKSCADDHSFNFP